MLIYIRVLISVFFAFLLAPTSAKSPLFIFGDSLLDAGNNNYINTTTAFQADFWPYGKTYFHFATGRFSDGRLIGDFIAEHANLPLIPPFLQPGETQVYDGVNFASGGGGALVETFQGSVIDIHMQLRNYKKVEGLFRDKFGDCKARKTLKSAVHLFSIGGNDYMTLFTANSSFRTTYTKSEYVSMVIGNITAVITEIHKTGGRKFAFINIPPLGCMPSVRILNPEDNGDCLVEALDYAILHNVALYRALNELEEQLPGFKYSLYDSYTNFQQRFDHPLKFGFKEGKTACCGSGKYRSIYSCGGTRDVKEFELCENVDDYVFWDSAHPTEKVYKQLADDMWNSGDSALSYGSYSIKELFQLP